jgi:LAS superfamily LD-carboxypeptidase LdcB
LPQPHNAILGVTIVDEVNSVNDVNMKSVRKNRSRRRIRRGLRRAVYALVILFSLGFTAFHALPGLQAMTSEQTGARPAVSKQSWRGEQSARDDYLILVNADNPISEDVPDFEIVSAYGRLPLLTSDVSLEEKTLDAVERLFSDARKAGIDNLLVNDGFRSYETQRRIYDEAEDKSLVQRPGCSEHQTGLAADIAANGVAGSAMGESAEGRWLADNAWRHGLILRYPQGKQEITGIAYEPWHFRYVGAKAAKALYESGLCLEEYIAEKSPRIE